MTKKRGTRTIFARPDDKGTPEEISDKAATDILLWMAETEEKRGNLENAKKLREEAGKSD